MSTAEATEVDLFECRGLNSCHALIEWRGLCPECQALADDARADAAMEALS
jgi:hypothetical protein